MDKLTFRRWFAGLLEDAEPSELRVLKMRLGFSGWSSAMAGVRNLGGFRLSLAVAEFSFTMAEELDGYGNLVVRLGESPIALRISFSNYSSLRLRFRSCSSTDFSILSLRKSSLSMLCCASARILLRERFPARKLLSLSSLSLKRIDSTAMLLFRTR